MAAKPHHLRKQQIRVTRMAYQSRHLSLNNLPLLPVSQQTTAPNAVKNSSPAICVTCLLIRTGSCNGIISPTQRSVPTVVCCVRRGFPCETVVSDTSGPFTKVKPTETTCLHIIVRSQEKNEFIQKPK